MSLMQNSNTSNTKGLYWVFLLCPNYWT